MSLEHQFVRAASQRAGMAFKLADTRRRPGVNGRQQHAKLTWSQVRAIRAWAAREGYGRQTSEQITALRARYRHVTPATLRAVLSHWSWRDRDYEPGQPDLDYWRDIPLPVAVLHVIGGGR